MLKKNVPLKINFLLKKKKESNQTVSILGKINLKNDKRRSDFTQIKNSFVQQSG